MTIKVKHLERVPIETVSKIISLGLNLKASSQYELVNNVWHKVSWL